MDDEKREDQPADEVQPPSEDKAVPADEEGRSDEARKQKPDAGEKGADRRESPDIQVGDVTAGRDQYVIYGNVPGSGEGTPLEALSRNHFDLLSKEKLQHRASRFIVEQEEIRQLVETVEGSHLVVIVGCTELGKGTMALQTAWRIWEQREKDLQEVMLLKSPERDVRVNLDKVAANASEYSHCVLIVEDAFRRDNRDLITAFKELDSTRLTSLKEALIHNGIYLILTSDAQKLPRRSGELRGLGVLQEVSGPGPRLRAKGLHRCAQRLTEASIGDETRKAIERLLKERGQHLSEELGTMPRVVKFVERYLIDVAKGDLTIERALEKLRDLSIWFLEELTSEPEAWSFALALTLAYSAPPSRGVPWFQFYRFWQEVAKFLRRKLRRLTRDLAPRDLCADDALLRKTRAEVRRAPFPGVDTVHFVDESYPERLWRVLLGPGRGVVSLLVPLLQRLTTEQDFYLREIAARALGRTGELDPGYVTFPMISAYASSEIPAHHVALGELFQGILGTEDAAYRAGCLFWLRRSTEGDDPRNVLVRAVCLREIGVFDLDLAIAQMRLLIDEKLADKAGELSELHQQLKRAEAQARKEAAEAGKTRLIDAVHDWVMDRIAADLIFPDRERAALAAVQFGLVGLCFAVDPIRVFEKLRPWLADDDDRGLASLVALLFLDGEGIAVKLGRYKIPVPTAEVTLGEPAPACNRILAAAALAPEATRTLGDFLERVFQSLAAFPGLFRKRLRANFLTLLKSWAGEAVESSVEELQDTVEELVAGLLSAQAPELREEIFGLLHRDRDFAASDSELRPLAIRILTRKTPGRRPPPPSTALVCPPAARRAKQVDQRSGSADTP